MSYGFKIIVEGDYACFTRPELKVERVSYDVPTPCAIEGLLKSIYWKPAIRYVIDKIIVYNPINFYNIRRNEVKNKISYKKMLAQMKGKNEDPCLYTKNIGSNSIISQRASMILKNVKYGVEFHFELTNIKNEEEENGEDKHYNIIKRRLEKGQHFRMPCLGCSEFPIKNIELVDEFNLDDIDFSLKHSGDIDLGFMCYKIKFEDGGIPKNNNWNNPIFSDKANAIYYRPHMINGVIDVNKYKEVVVC